MTAATATDPTLASLEQLDDPSKWVIVQHVPVCVPFARKMQGRDVKVTEADLDTIMSRMQALEADSGVIGRLTLGHTQPGQPQTSQPPIVGFVRFESVGHWGPAKKLGILATLYYRRDSWDAAQEYPYRSMEYYDDGAHADTIPGVALLKTDPELDMGMLIFHRGEPFLYFRSETMPDSPVDPPKAEEKKETQAPAAAAAPAGPEGVDPAYHENFMRCARHHKMVPFAEAEAPAVPPPAVPPAPAAPPPAPFNRSTDPVLADLQAQLAKERADRQTFQLQYERGQVHALLGELSAAGYHFDRDDEMERMTPMGAEARAARVKKIMAQSWQRPAPVGGDLLQFGRLPKDGHASNARDSDVITAQHAEAAKQFQRRNAGVSWETALEKTKASA